jgi:hypothetical protein
MRGGSVVSGFAAKDRSSSLNQPGQLLHPVDFKGP